MNHDQLLDAALAYIIKPLEQTPDKKAEFLKEHMYAPLEGTVEARQKAQTDALAAMGITPDQVGRMMKKKEPDG